MTLYIMRQIKYSALITRFNAEQKNRNFRLNKKRKITFCIPPNQNNNNNQNNNDDNDPFWETMLITTSIGLLGILYKS